MFDKCKLWNQWQIFKNTFKDTNLALPDIANKIQNLTATLNKGLQQLNIKQLNCVYFDTLSVEVSDAKKVKEIAYDLNTSRVVISRILKALENKGKIKLNRAYIELL